MSGRVYFVDRSGITGEFVSEAQARRLFERYRGSDGFEGDLASAFTYRPQPLHLALAPPVTLRGPVLRVHLVPDREVPADVRERLAGGAGARADAP